MMRITHPKGILPETKKFINVVVKKLEEVNAIEECDAGAIRMLTISYDMYIRASQDLIDKGPILYDKRNKPSVNPATRIAKNYYAQVLAFMKEYGLTVKARENIKSMTPSVDENNELLKFLKDE